MIFDPYCSAEQLENKTASISVFEIFDSRITFMHGSHAKSKIDRFERLVNLLVAYEQIATFRTQNVVSISLIELSALPTGLI